MMRTGTKCVQCIKRHFDDALRNLCLTLSLIHHFILCHLVCFILLGVLFLRREAVHNTGYAMSRYIFVCPSVTFVYCIETSKRIVELLSPGDSLTILVFFSYETLRTHSTGFLLIGGVECRLDMETRSSAVAERPCDGPCRWKFRSIAQSHSKLPRWVGHV